MKLLSQTHITGIALFFLGAFFLLAANSRADNTETALNVHRAAIRNAQEHATEAHEALEKARAATAAAVEAEQKAQEIVNGYTDSAKEAREAICALGKEFCTTENLDPLNRGVNVDEYFR